MEDYLSCNIAVFVTYPSRQGFKYVIAITDPATKYSWLYTIQKIIEAFGCVKISWKLNWRYIDDHWHIIMQMEERNLSAKDSDYCIKEHLNNIYLVTHTHNWIEQGVK